MKRCLEISKLEKICVLMLSEDVQLIHIYLNPIMHNALLNFTLGITYIKHTSKITLCPQYVWERIVT